MTDGEDNDLSINLAFGKEKNSSNLRKNWLSEYEKTKTLDYDEKTVSIKEFVDNDLIHFSNSDNIRSIPSVIDGFKPSQRKVLYCCFKRKLDNEIRVAQLAGYVSEHGAYHHGEASLQGTIINMAQDFVGSNNINLLDPIGQFGTRLHGGKDSAQPRYIYTKLQEISYKLFNKDDEDLYQYIEDDGEKVEPNYYVPTLPMLLINGTSGIGTGWSTNIPCFNPKDIIKNIKLYNQGIEMEDMTPYYKGFKGKIVKSGDNYITKGNYEIKKDKIIITELPINVWVQNYKNDLEKLILNNEIRYYNSYCTDTKIHIEIVMDEDKINSLNKIDKNGDNKLESKLKLTSNISMSNMIAFNADGKITKYNNVKEILKEYIEKRLDMYVLRKANKLKIYEEEIKYLNMKVKFIKEFIENKIQITNKKKADIVEQLTKRKYIMKDNSFDYLLRLPIYSLTKEKVDELNNNTHSKISEYEKLKGKTNKDLWEEDYTVIEKYFNDFEETQPKKKKFKVKLKK